jgi:hypothetical protein
VVRVELVPTRAGAGRQDYTAQAVPAALALRVAVVVAVALAVLAALRVAQVAPVGPAVPERSESAA